ncbi:DUF3558 family protein [Nocardia terpenica]|uniref:DUF3558 domain-containing protein n=1 Tax=Nocardia terpenica TaxID=455432 RepID=A0A291RF80_9NOCA|nr:DUF3558 family protein [Nocardia terpenica]ATL65969.1 hypothetical protein CRH09_06845 [Nocardia terpenica]
MRRLLTTPVKAICTLALAVAAAGCSGGSTPAPRPAVDDPNVLAGCGPLADAAIAAQLQASAARQQTSPTICTWKVDHPGGTTDLTYAWLANDTLMRDSELAAQQGYRIEKTVIKRFGAMYWRDPRDPGSCAVTAFDGGTVTWWVQNRDHAAQPDPCAAAMTLMQSTLAVDGI